MPELHYRGVRGRRFDTIKHDRATFDRVVAQRHRDESRTFYDVVGVDGSDVTLLKVRQDDFTHQRQSTAKGAGDRRKCRLLVSSCWTV